MAQRGGSHGYCLKWKYHPNNLLHMFNQLLLNESFTDVLVACEGKTIKCHKMVLSACSKYFEQVFSEYPMQNSTLVILKDMKFADVQAIIEFMYQGEINVAHDQLSSLLKSAESLQVKGLADITGGGNGNGTPGASTSLSGVKEEDMGGMDMEDAGQISPRSASQEGSSEGGNSLQDGQQKRKRRSQLPMGMEGSVTGDVGGMSLAGANQMMQDGGGQFEDFGLGNLLESHFAVPKGRKNRKSKFLLGAPASGPAEIVQHDDDDVNDGNDVGEDDEVTEEELQNIVKMAEYIEKGGSRPQFWEEPTTKKIMNAIRSKKMEMKQAAEILGVSYSTLYSRYRELHGYLKMPHTQDTNFNYYQVLNLLRAGQITLSDAAKRLNIHEKTLGAYLTTSITPKKPKLSMTPPSTSGMNTSDNFAMNLLEQVTLQGNQISNVLEKQQINYNDEDDESDGDLSGHGKMPVSSELLQDDNSGGWNR